MDFPAFDAKWKKHAAEFPEFVTSQDYRANARRLAGQGRATDDILIGRRKRDGAVMIYERSSNTITISDRHGVVQTCFRPLLAEAYFRVQIA